MNTNLNQNQSRKSNQNPATNTWLNPANPRQLRPTRSVRAARIRVVGMSLAVTAICLPMAAAAHGAQLTAHEPIIATGSGATTAADLAKIADTSPITISNRAARGPLLTRSFDRLDSLTQDAEKTAAANAAASVRVKRQRVVHGTRLRPAPAPVVQATPAATPAAPTSAPAVPAPATGGIIAIAQSYLGVPYVYGGSTPAGFDCSGFTSYVFARAGKYLPRTSAAQAGATIRIAASQAVPGDLVFFTGSGGVYHVGIYAGGGSIIHAPRPGSSVRYEQIWTSSVFYGRVR